jgi:hypothetical protein
MSPIANACIHLTLVADLDRASFYAGVLECKTPDRLLATIRAFRSRMDHGNFRS